MKLFLKIIIIAFPLFFEGCTSSKTEIMNKTKDSTFSCNTETGVCLPNEQASSEEKIVLNSGVKAEVKLIYYFDALCGWCYGFSPVVSKLQETYKNKIDFEVISGGLFLGNRVGTVNDVAPYIKAGAYKSVESRTGVKFGKSFFG